MARIAFILLCHKDPDVVVAQARELSAAGDYVAIHFDGRAPASQFAAIERGIAGEPNIVVTKPRVKCGWGEWSLVEATLNTLRKAVDAFPRASHFYMISGDCRAIKSARHAHAMLDSRDVDYIESVDFFDSDWIKTGMKEERLIYRHLVNERRHKRTFYALLEMQRRLGLSRSIPPDIEVMIGSQWWCLRRPTVEKVLAFIDRRRDVVRFFRTTWIPDETFFQTLVRHLVPRAEIESRTLTFLMFTDYGMPATFHDDHHDLLLAQDYLFARKISPEAHGLLERLGALWSSDRTDFPIAGDGRRLFEFLTQRGRVGRRFAQRFWERESSLGRERELIVIVCKKWHVAKRLAATAREALSIPVVEYLFDEEETALPDLGGIDRTLAKRHRHRRAVLRMLYNRFEADRLVICLDPARHDLVADFAADRSLTRVLLVECDTDDAYLRGHAERIGLIGDSTPDSTIRQILPTLTQDVVAEFEQIRAIDLEHLYRIDEGMDEATLVATLTRVFTCDEETAALIARTPHLFDD
ncbi:DUF5928 domain-containing protein [Jannaschia aquimarina]|uniref:Peptide O-xylosyltransferase n=1 Tax=Jannaschia aquimarina TaxID=935700 RepID=A0A0D1CJF5_9RHOB|nr:DUF5928 domain-containing protein [Jannaschia aquimarina]KIT14812.1 Core-2/I-Branching enzyme [Jannaschia aquimarina]SNS56688.1 Core-2/I-Branching enzyme [Jannaschia aquimarina]